MALYDGFFDATLNEETYQYDREYNSGDFTEYFASSIGSGVCIYNNVSSMRVSWDGTAAVVAPGYLFIEGYWLKNDGYYSVPLSEAGTHAILAYLNTGARRIEIISQLKADPEEYPSALCLAYVTIDGTGAGTVEDTRYNTDICGVIDSAGDLSSKVEYAINYIDNEVEGKLAEAEAAIEAQAVLLDEKIAEVNAQVEKLAPDPIGTVKFSASSTIEEGWLRCDGSFISETDYPELVAALGKKYPSGDKFTLLSEGEIGQNITNPVIWNGRIWVYSYTEQSLYGVGLNGEATKTILVSSDDTYFSTLVAPTNTSPLCLSILTKKKGTGGKLCLCQSKENTSSLTASTNADFTISQENFYSFLCAFWSDFTGEEESIIVNSMFTSMSGTGNASTSLLYSQDGRIMPYVISKLVNDAEIYYLCVLDNKQGYHASYSPYVAIAEVQDENDAATLQLVKSGACNYITTGIYGVGPQRHGFNPNNKNEFLSLKFLANSSNTSALYTLYSWLDNVLYHAASSSIPGTSFSEKRAETAPFTITGENHIVADFIVDSQCVRYGCFLKSQVSGLYVTSRTFLPVAARDFPDAGAYLWGKDIYMFFVGTGLVFFRDPADTSDIGYLDTTEVMGTITNFGCLRYSQDENTLYLVGQDTSNKIKIAKMELNTLFDYANDGAWLPLIASDGIPAYIKAFEPETTTEEA